MLRPGLEGVGAVVTASSGGIGRTVALWPAARARRLAAATCRPPHDREGFDELP